MFEGQNQQISRTNQTNKPPYSITDGITERRFGNLQQSINQSEKEEPIVYNAFSMVTNFFSPKAVTSSTKRQEYVKTTPNANQPLKAVSQIDSAKNNSHLDEQMSV